MLRITLLVILLSLGLVSAKKFAVMAPNMFHVGVEERVSVSVFDAGQTPVTVKLYLQDYPHRAKTFSQVEGVVRQGQTTYLTVKVDPQDIPDISYGGKKYVYLVATSDDAHFQFNQKAKVLLSEKDRVVFIQTDKPIYTPKQDVRIRVIPLGLDMKPSTRKITVVVKNPQGIKVRQWKDLNTTTGIIRKRLLLGNNEIIGIWTITALHGYKDVYNTSVQFEVREYVLPKFSVKLTVPQFILKSDKNINVNINTRYTYGKPVVGFANVYFKIAGFNVDPLLVSHHILVLDRDGVTTVKASVDFMREVLGERWFPEGNRLQVEVNVVEKATGNKETAMDNSCHFTSSPYLIEFKNTPKYFKPGLRFVVKVAVTYPNKQPVADVRMLITAKIRADDSDELVELTSQNQDANNVDITNAKGQAEFILDACSKCKFIAIKVRSDNRNLNKTQNAAADFVVNAFQNEGGSFIMVRQLTVGKVGEKIRCESYRNSAAREKLSFAVVARGKIVYHNTTEPFDGLFKSWSFRVTPEMSPSARLIGYYIDKNEQVVADSVLLNIEDRLPTKVDFPDGIYAPRKDGTLFQVNKLEQNPGTLYQLRVDAPEGTVLGLLGVDESVYLLRDKNRLTAKRIFQAVEELDLGCGVGRGKDNRDIFKNAGVVLLTNKIVSDGREDYGCEEAESRKKRDLGSDLDEELKVCCDLGKENVSVSCWRRFLHDLKNANRQCKKEFWRCCSEMYGLKDFGMLARSGADMSDAPTDDEMFNTAQFRTDFRETWMFDDSVVGPSGQYQMNYTIPSTITTWVLQAVAINPQTGLGLAKPLNVMGYQDLFISLKLPYSVKRGEQVSLLATVFNYRVHDEFKRAKIYLTGSDDFCSLAGNGERVLIGTVDVPRNDARSVAVPIIPKRKGWIEIEVFVIFQEKHGQSYINAGGDGLRRKLLVEPEGVQRRKSQSFILDPNEILRDDSQSGDSKPNVTTATVFKSKKIIRAEGQSDTITLEKPKNTIPGSVGAFLYVTGNLLGPVINTTIEGGLDEKFVMPSGCGEQMMKKMAPNVYVLKYLTKIKKLTGEDEGRAHEFIQIGYQGELAYRRSDKSFSAGGESRPGSTWLTAFVMRVFCEARQFEGVEIDERVVCESVNYIIGVQRSDGAIPELHPVSSTNMVGGAYNEGDVGMTAFVLTALAECGCPNVNSAAAISRARSYLENQYNNLVNPYSMALTAYALSMVNSTVKYQANQKLIENAIFDEVTKARYWNTGRNALDVETAGYALMTQLNLGRVGYAGPIVTYLTTQRRGGIGFVSTQDTVVALQALALYSEKTAGRGLDLRVKLTAELKKDWLPPEIHITSENALLRREFDIKRFLGGELYVDSHGTGAALAQVEVWYNVPSTPEETCTFILRTNVHEVKEEGKIFGPVQNDEEDGEDDTDKNANKAGKGRKGKKKGRKKGKKGKGGKRKGNRESGGKRRKGCKGKNKKDKRCRPKKVPQKYQPVKSILLNVCTRYEGSQDAGMSIIDIGIFTGFKPDEESLKKLKETVPEIFLDEVSDRALVLYLDMIPWEREICFNVTFDREYYVGEVQPVPVNVYDYYDPDQSCSVFYGPGKSSPLRLGVCDVGSKSCKCSQDECAQDDPYIGNIGKLMRLACTVHNYVIKGRVAVVYEQGTMLRYTVKVLQIMQQGNQDLKVGDTIELKKRGSCQTTALEELEDYLFMGLDKGGEYNLDKTSFVKLWPKDPNEQDRKVLDDFAQQFSC